MIRALWKQCSSQNNTDIFLEEAISALTAEESRTQPRVGGDRGVTGSEGSVERQRKQHKHVIGVRENVVSRVRDMERSSGAGRSRLRLGIEGPCSRAWRDWPQVCT